MPGAPEEVQLLSHPAGTRLPEGTLAAAPGLLPGCKEEIA